MSLKYHGQYFATASTRAPGMTATPQDYGLVPYFMQQTSLDELEHGRVCRVTEVQRSVVTVCNGPEELVVPAGSERLTIGDWVVLDNKHTRIERALERKSLFQRVAAGERADIQLIAANIDLLFVVTSCNEDFNASRLERYLAMAAEAGVIPVVVLTKSDLTTQAETFIDRARAIQAGLAVELVNGLDPNTLDSVRAWIEPGSTIALVGSSGVGKSTLLNALAESNVAATRTISEQNDKGRHTTSHRSLHQLPGGGLLIDVPGMRELKVAELSTALGVVFDDIESLAVACRYADCAHDAEPGCAVLAAVERGEIEERRLQNYKKLLRENAHNSASLAEKRARGRDFAKVARQAKSFKQGKNSKS